MTNYTFMKTGSDVAGTPSSMAEKMISLVVVLVRRAAIDALTYAEHSGRTTATKEDVERSLKYQARTFFTSEDLESSMDEAMRELFDDDDEWTTDDDAEDDEAEADDDDAEDAEVETEADAEADAETEEPFKESRCECKLCTDINACYHTWTTWTPDDPVEQFLKTHVEKAITGHLSS